MSEGEGRKQFQTLVRSALSVVGSASGALASAAVGFTVERGVDQRGQFYQMIGIVLQLGNVKFAPAPGDSDGAVVSNPDQFATVAELMRRGRGNVTASVGQLRWAGREEVLSSW